MRIQDNAGSFTSDQGSRESGRQRAFRATYKVGDLLLGTVRDYETDGMAWVSIGELRVLAELTRRYPLGSEIYLIVTCLHPNIILQEADAEARKGAQGLNIIV